MITIIPAIDLIGGECVRLSQGDYDRKTTYFKDPLDAAKRYEAIGIKRLHLVDLDGAKAAAPVNLDVLRRITTNTTLEVQYGGGIKNADALRAVFENGATRAICGSIAVTQPEKMAAWLEEFGPERIVLGADAKNGRIATHGWLQESEITIEQLIEKFIPQGLSQVICTDIAKDGMLQGPTFDLYDKLQNKYPTVEITVSGGISSLDDILRLDKAGMRGVIVGKAIYEGRITLQQLEQCLQNE